MNFAISGGYSVTHKCSLFANRDLAKWLFWSEALIIIGIYKYITILLKFRKTMVISRVLLNLYKPKMLKN
jgi:hypothetical protein